MTEEKAGRLKTLLHSERERERDRERDRERAIEGSYSIWCSRNRSVMQTICVTSYML